jgi:ATP-dependent Lon protease
VVNRPPSIGSGAPLPDSAAFASLELAERSGKHFLAVAQRDPAVLNPRAQDLHPLGTIAHLAESQPTHDGGRRIELDGRRRARVITVIGLDTLVAEVQPIDEGDAGDEWGPAVEALARYLHAHAELRSFLEEQRRSQEPMSWVNLACQHFPITASARQKLLECDAPERCLKISRGLDALLRKEHTS